MPDGDTETTEQTTTVDAPAATTTTTTTTDAPAATDTDNEPDETALDEKAKAALAKVRREAANLRQRLKELEPKAAKLKEIEDKDKTESQKLADQLAEANKKIATFQLREVQLEAASAAGLPANMAQFITATDPTEAKAQAKMLAEWGKAGNGAVDFKQGARPNTQPKLTGDEVLRRMAGRK